MEAHSSSTGKTYPSWEALVEAEANGYVVVAVIADGKQTWPWVEGLYPTKAEASKARNRMRTKLNRESTNYPSTSFRLFVRPAWKDGRKR